VEYGSIWQHKKSGLRHFVLEVTTEQGGEAWKGGFDVPKDQTTGIPVIVTTWSEDPPKASGESFMGLLHEFIAEFTFIRAAKK